ncbi:MAG: hypothetical protein ACLFUJ_02955 [Phycisphaerae bacterium]
MKVALLVGNRRWVNPTAPWQPIARGLMRLGCQVHVIQPPRDGRLGFDLDVAMVWNGMKPPAAAHVDRLRRSGKQVLILERGFFDRDRHVQIDPAGFNHMASWAEQLATTRPPGKGAERFFRVWGARPSPMQSRDHGEILILCQVDSDAQLRDCPIHHAQHFVQAVLDASPCGIDINIRPHPAGQFKHPLARKESLAQAVGRARFCVTLNSNAANEAIARGCPVLTLGPSLAAAAGVSLPGRLDRLDTDLQTMIDGWHPDSSAARNFLYHLASRQYDNAELAEAGCLAPYLKLENMHGHPPAIEPV